MFPRIRPLIILVLIVGTRPAPADELSMSGSTTDTLFFESKIRPVLVQHCYPCHSAEAGHSKGNLRLDTREAIRAGGDQGPAVVPGDPDASLLLRAISHADADLEMPPNKGRLSDSVIADVRTWIRAGAEDPREAEATAESHTPLDIEAGRRFWAFQKPVSHEPPVIRDRSWPRRDIDAFILAKLESAKLTPSPDADPAVLLRRLYFDLVGLPPSPEAIDDFLQRIEKAGIDQALASEVDVLLASPHFGERWGRHWLDVARFAESSGKEANISFPYAWRYRDYVIDAMNTDTPFDRFVVEQVAGDLLPSEGDADRARLMIATGFLAVGPKNLDESNKAQFQADLIDEQIDAMTQGLLASSVACARCHDHKIDPFSMEDYYALAGVFTSTRTFFGTFISPSNQVGGDPMVLPRGADQPILHESIPPERVAALQEELAALKKEKATTIQEALRIFWKSGGIEGQLEKVDETGRALPLAMGATDHPTIADAPFLERGEVGRPGQTVPRGFPRVLAISNMFEVPSDHSGRLELAGWMTHPDHPLTARVLTNRVWRHLFGTGLVRTVDNFGASGESPSHPELLDTLAVRFVSQGWSLKALIREIVLSRTYRQSSTYRKDAFRSDPENRLLWRAAKRRLDAEAIRDAMLAASGDLDPLRPIGSLVGRVIGDRPISLIGLDDRLPKDLDGAKHRSVYLPILRDRLPDVLDLFDFAEPSLVTGDRETTNVPLQALYLMNSPFVHARAEALADRLLRESDDDTRIHRLFLLCFGRGPTPDEARLTASFFVQDAASPPDEATQRRRLTACCQAMLATAEFRNLD